MKIDKLHIALIFLACIVAYILPFELFLFSYVVLGPLHYLTELAWLHEKKYFSSSKVELLIIFFCAVVVSINYIVYRVGIDIATLIPSFKSHYSTHFIFLAWVAAFSSTLLKKWQHKLYLFLFFLLGVYLIRNQFYYLFFIGLLLPTLIHVFVFTTIFMLLGIRRNNNFWTKICFISFIVCAISFFITPAYLPSHFISKETEAIYLTSGFEILNKTLLYIFDGVIFDTNDTKLIFTSSLSIKIQRFVAFAYTYHYLNWFLKVKVIAWYKIDKIRLFVALFLWLISLGIYFYDFKVGILTLYFLSMLHVFMEFPLNIQSIKALIKR
ncbi:hypothetical protein [Bernardetia sp.]|uniref:hypothetical protein n=1 Tax=Bernardetia sp. TaxID=1937974 RepID=UPI0025BF3FF6|nr:hypothetical protein [Bernardetia sp.]